MPTQLQHFWRDDDGVLAFEWVMLLTLLTVGIVGGIAAGRDAIIDELGDTAEVMLAVDQSYHIGFPLVIGVHDLLNSSASDSDFTDALLYSDCGRAAVPAAQTLDLSQPPLSPEIQGQLSIEDIDS